MSNRLSYILLLGFLALCASAPAHAQVAYANITDVTATQLSNGVQIIVKADGVLDWDYARRSSSGTRGAGDFRRDRVVLSFPNARSKVSKSFIDVSLYPVSFVQIEVPQEAAQREGVGIRMTIALFEPADSDVSTSPDRQSVIITVNSERTLESVQRNGGAAAGAKKAELSVEFEDNLLTVNALRADIHELIGEIARQTGVNVAVDSGVSHKVSLTLANMPVEVVLRGIASGYGLALNKQGDVFMLSEGVPTDLATYNRSSTASFRMKNIQAQTASGLLPTFLFSYLHVNHEQNAVVVQAPSQMLTKIESDLKNVDLPASQIMVEALAVEFTTTDDVEAALNVRWRDLQLSDSTLSPTGWRSDSATGEISFRHLASLPHDFQARINALVSQGKAKVWANPRMAAVNGQRAELFIGTQKFIKVRFLQFGSLSERIQGVDVGVKLEVTPWTGGNGEITTRIEPEVSNISELDPETGLPLLSTRRAGTSIRVKDGETIVIGGLIQKQDQRLRRRVPILGDIPIIGTLFQSKERHAVDTELVIFITPRILTPEGRLPDAEKEKQMREKFLPEGKK